MRNALTRVEAGLRAWADARLVGRRGPLVELLVFAVKQAWAAIFGGLLLGLFLLLRHYPADAVVSRPDLLTLLAVVIQLAMLVLGLETVRELRVVLLFHVVGTVMELFKTAAGSWAYPAEGVLRVGEVPLYSGFMYAAVGSYMVRVHRLFDLRFDRWPRRWLTALLAAAIYVNFFSHHWWWDARWVLVALVAVTWGRSVMHYRVHDRAHRMPVLVSFLLVALVIWLAENVATFAGAWFYPGQELAWELVHPAKISSWFLLMIISVVLVTWVYPPRERAVAAAAQEATGQQPARGEAGPAPARDLGEGGGVP